MVDERQEHICWGNKRFAFMRTQSAMSSRQPGWEDFMTQAGRDGSHDGGTYGSAIAAEGWQRGATARAMGPITERMLDLAGIGSGHRVLDVGAGTGEQTLMAARRVGPHGFVLATDIADRMLAYLDEAARNEGL